MKTGLGDPQGDSVLPDVGSLSPQSEQAWVTRKGIRFYRTLEV